MCATTKMQEVLKDIFLDIKADVKALITSAVEAGYFLTLQGDGWKPKIKMTYDILAGIVSWMDANLVKHEVLASVWQCLFLWFHVQKSFPGVHWMQGLEGQAWGALQGRFFGDACRYWHPSDQPSLCHDRP